MYHRMLILLMFLLFGASVFLLFFNIYRKFQMTGRLKRAAIDRKIIMQKIDGFIDSPEPDFKNGLDDFAGAAMAEKQSYRDVIDEYLLFVLENIEVENRDRYIAIAWRLDFTADCLDQIRDRNPGISADGCRRAGLYNYRDAIDDMINTLGFMSSENQFEILLGLARMGDADAMQKAFEKIKMNVIINERAIIQILSSFPKGQKKSVLFGNMIHSNTDYISALFLKALNNEMAGTLEDDIISALHEGSKEVRAAAVRSLANLGKDAPVNELVQALEDHDWEVRALAAKALESVKVPESTMALYGALHDQQWWVRQNAANSLAGHPGYEALFVLAAESGDEYTRDSIIYALEKKENPVLLRSIKILAA